MRDAEGLVAKDVHRSTNNWKLFFNAVQEKAPTPSNRSSGISVIFDKAPSRTARRRAGFADLVCGPSTAGTNL